MFRDYNTLFLAGGSQTIRRVGKVDHVECRLLSGSLQQHLPGLSIATHGANDGDPSSRDEI